MGLVLTALQLLGAKASQEMVSLAQGITRFPEGDEFVKL